MVGKPKATTWAEMETLPAAARESFRANFTSWANDHLAPDMAHYWPMTDRPVRGMRSPHGFTQRSPSGWPECWFEHGWVRDCLLTAYVWDQEIATGKDATAGADRAAYQEHVRNVVVPEVQQIAQMCALGHMDPAEQPIGTGPWQPAPPPLPGDVAFVVVPDPPRGTESPEGARPPPRERPPVPRSHRHPLMRPATSSPGERTATALDG